MNISFYVADFKLKNGRINKTCVWFGEKGEYGVDLEKFKDNPMELICLSDKIHIQNPYTAIVIKTNCIEDIKIYAISDNEWS